MKIFVKSRLGTQQKMMAIIDALCTSERIEVMKGDPGFIFLRRITGFSLALEIGGRGASG